MPAAEPDTRPTSARREPFWLVIALFSLAASALLAYHWSTGRTPDRAAITLRVAGFEFPIYWYGLLIMGGILLGAWVTARLAEARARQRFETVVSADIRAQPLSNLPLPPELRQLLAKRHVHHLGDLLYGWGIEPRGLGLNAAGLKKTQAVLAKWPGVKAAWLTDAPWQVWSPEHVWTGLLWCIVLGVIGARLYHVLTPSPSLAALGITSPLDYFRDPARLINLRNGGLGLYGALIGGLLGLVLYTRRRRLPWLAWADLAAVGLPLGQFVGRWGNFLNQELYGGPTALPWGIHIDHPLGNFAPGTTFRPAFLYESLWNLVAFLGLYSLARRYADRLRAGELMGLYLVWYGFGRILLETVRLDSRMLTLGNASFPIASVISALIILVTLTLLGLRRLRPQPSG